MTTLLFAGVILSVAYASIISPSRPKRPDFPYGFNDRLGKLRNEGVIANELIIKEADETERKDDDDCLVHCVKVEGDCTHNREGCCQEKGGNPVYCWCYPNMIRLQNGSMGEKCFCEDSGDY